MKQRASAFKPENRVDYYVQQEQHKKPTMQRHWFVGMDGSQRAPTHHQQQFSGSFVSRTLEAGSKQQQQQHTNVHGTRTHAHTANTV